jgi:hypothetical protein
MYKKLNLLVSDFEKKINAEAEAEAEVAAET